MVLGFLELTYSATTQWNKFSYFNVIAPVSRRRAAAAP